MSKTAGRAEDTSAGVALAVTSDLSFRRRGGDGAVRRHGRGGVFWDGGRLRQRAGEAALLTGPCHGDSAVGTVPTRRFALRSSGCRRRPAGKPIRVR